MPYVPELQQFFDNSGDPLAGGKLYFYASGETHTGGTLQSTYSDAARTSANANPVVLDANGRLPNAVYMDPTLEYLVALDTSADANLWQIDNVYGTATLDQESERRRAIANSPVDHGAAGDGSTDDATALQAALDRSGAKVIDLEGKTYRCDSILTMSSGQTLRNGKIDFSNASIAAGIRCQGSVESTPRAVTSAAAASQTITPDSTTGIAVGDLVRLRSSDAISGTHKYAELFRVEQISGSNILVDGSIEGTYSTAPLVEEITPISDVILDRVTIVAPTGGYAADFNMCLRVTLRNCIFTSTANAEAVRFVSVYDAIIDGCRFNQKTTAEAGGLIVGDASRDVTVTKCRFERQLRAIEIGADYEATDGLTRDVTVKDCIFQWFGTNSCDIGTVSARWIGNTFLCDIAPSATSNAISILGGNIEIKNNIFRNYSENAININLTVSADYIDIQGNTFVGDSGSTHCIEVESNAVTLTSLRVVGNALHASAAARFVLHNGTTITTLDVVNNTCHWGAATGYVCDINGPTEDIAHLKISGNTAYNGTICTATPSSNGTEVSAAVLGNITNLDVVESMGNGNNATWSQKAVIGNIATGGSGTPINIRNQTDGAANTDACLVALNVLSIPTSSDPAIQIVGGNNVGVVGNVCGTASTTGGDRGILVDNEEAAVPMQNVLVSSNIVWSEVEPISIDASGGDEIDNVVIAGNVARQTVATAAGGVIALAPSGGKLVRSAVVGNVCVRADDNDDNILPTAAEEIVIVGNVTVNGAYSVDISGAGVTNDVVAGNVLLGFGTGAVNGTADVNANNDIT